jgi:high-affinity iron transporter
MVPVLVMSLALSGCDAGGRRASEWQDTPAARARGRALFLEHCALCHGEAADGRGVRHSALTGRPQDFTDPSWARRTSPEQAFAIIRDGKRETSMPAWRTLDEERIRDLVVYLRSVATHGAEVAP